MNRGSRGNRGNRGNRGFRGSPRGKSRGRGFSRGRGRGGFNGFALDPRVEDAMDFVVQQWPEEDYTPFPRGGRGGRGTNSGHQTPRGNANRARGLPSSPYNNSRGQTPTRGSTRGRGRGSSILPANAPLSMRLNADRPFLKPVIFVRSVYTATLFQQEEEILQNVAEGVDEREESHVPTAERINRIFFGGDFDLSSDEEELEVVDFNDLARIRAEVDAAPPKARSKIVSEPQFTGRILDPPPHGSDMITQTEVVEATMVSEHVPTVQEAQDSTTRIDSSEATIPLGIELENEEANRAPLGVLSTVEREITIAEPSPFYIDTSPAKVPDDMVPSSPPKISSPPIVGPPPDDEDIIVYVAPHPRRPVESFTPGPSAPSREPPKAENPPPPLEHTSVSFSFANSPAPKLAARRNLPVLTSRERRRATLQQRLREARVNKKRGRGSFGTYGAIMSEYQLHENEDPKFEERRRGDSDIDWGDEDEEGDVVAEGMQLDNELELDTDAMRSFVDGMGAKGGQWISGDDIADALKMQAEDEGEDQNGTSSSSEGDDDDSENDEDELDIDAIMEAEERHLVGEPEDSEEVSDDSDEDFGFSPQSSFQARLERLRKQSRSKKARDSPRSSSEGDEDDGFGTWADQDEDFIAEIQAILDENEDILKGRDRKQRNRLFRAVENGSFDYDLDSMVQPTKKKKHKADGIPVELRAQWDKDRSKKAERKRLREQAKLRIASDPLAKKKGGKKGKKAMLAAARLSPSTDMADILPNRIMSMSSLEQQIRRFLQELDGPQDMSLPPMDKAVRKQVHEMALAFNLKSVSKGKGKARYTTLIKTTRSGININEKKVARLVKSGRGWSTPGDWDFKDHKGKERSAAAPRHKDGDIVGKAAPKIGHTNIGFQMLASMGWSEGDRIGVSGGLDVPLVAIMKNTKLGLGATR